MLSNNLPCPARASHAPYNCYDAPVQPIPMQDSIQPSQLFQAKEDSQRPRSEGTLPLFCLPNLF